MKTTLLLVSLSLLLTITSSCTISTTQYASIYEAYQSQTGKSCKTITIRIDPNNALSPSSITAEGTNSSLILTSENGPVPSPHPFAKLELKGFQNLEIVDLHVSESPDYAFILTDIQSITIHRCLFFNNAGAISTNSKMEISHSTFSGHYQYTALYTMIVDISYCTFSDNIVTTARSYGAALWAGAIASISHSNFVNNTNPLFAGGAIGATRLNSLNNTFTNNQCTSTDLYGRLGGAIWAGNVHSFGDSFSRNEAPIGGAVYVSSEGTFGNANFMENSATEGGAIQGHVIFVNGSSFIGNRANNGAGLTSTRFTLTDCVFENNLDGAAVLAGSGSESSVIDCTFTKNTVGLLVPLSGRGPSVLRSRFTANGLGIRVEAGRGIGIGSCVFENQAGAGAATSHDGFIYASDSLFIKNGGGGITGFSVTKNCTFIENSSSSGGALYGYSLTIENCTFIRNRATKGGAIHLEGYSAGLPTIKDSIFISNTASFGGVLSDARTGSSDTFVVSNSLFENNEATDSGGVFYSLRSVPTISESRFRNNRAKSGGVMFMNVPTYGSGASIGASIGSSTVTGNLATVGAALYLAGGNITISTTTISSESDIFLATGTFLIGDGSISITDNRFSCEEGREITTRPQNLYWCDISRESEGNSAAPVVSSPTKVTSTSDPATLDQNSSAPTSETEDSQTGEVDENTSILQVTIPTSVGKSFGCFSVALVVSLLFHVLIN